MKIGIKGLPKIEKTTAVKNYFDSLENEPLFIVSFNKIEFKCLRNIKKIV